MKRGKILEGVVKSDKCDKTIIVLVKMKLSHQLYKKLSVKMKRYKVHDKDNKAKVGDRVTIVECRPFSKEKRFKLVDNVK